MAPTIRVDDEVYAYLQHAATPFVDTPNDVLRRILLSSPSDPRSRSAGSLRRMLDSGVLRAGDILTWSRRDAWHRAELTEDALIVLADGTSHATPSAAAKHLAGYEINGMKAWRVERVDRSLSELADGADAARQDKEQDMDATGDDGYLAALPGHLVEAGRALLADARKLSQGSLVRKGRRYVNDPDNFWTVTIQPQDGSLLVTVRGRAARFAGSPLTVTDDRPGHSKFKVRRLDDVEPAIDILRRAKRR